MQITFRCFHIREVVLVVVFKMKFAGINAIDLFGFSRIRFLFFALIPQTYCIYIREKNIAAINIMEWMLVTTKWQENDKRKKTGERATSANEGTILSQQCRDEWRAYDIPIYVCVCVCFIAYRPFVSVRFRSMDRLVYGYVA